MNTSSAPCQCDALNDLAVIDMGEHEDALRHFAKIADRGDRWWWLYASRCESCGQVWLVAQEERQNDVFILRRLDAQTTARLIQNDEWPRELDSYEALLKIGLCAGKKVHFFDPFDSSLRCTIEDLARERPGISVSDLTTLLNLEPCLADQLGRMVSMATGVTIDFDIS